MNHVVPQRPTRRSQAAVIGCLLLFTTLLGGHALPARADELVAAEASPAVSGDRQATPATVPSAVSNRPRTITVTNHGGRSVTLFAKGERIRRVLAPGRHAAVFRGLTPGRLYTVAVGGQAIGAVVALNRPYAATGLQVRSDGSPGSVTLTWRHRITTATGGRAIRYEVTATAKGAPVVRASATGVPRASVIGLDPDLLYTFTVRPRNDAGTGRVTIARMTRTLGQITGGPAGTSDHAPSEPAGQPSAPEPSTPAAAPAPAPAPPPAPAPAGPRTTTIWVCPDGYAEVAGQCLTTKPYTFHTETQTQPYTYHSEQQVDTKTVPATFDGSVWTWSCPSGYSAGGGQWGVGICKGTVTVQVKDAPPQGWYDTGSRFGQDIEVKDALPDGYLDDGSQWVKTTAKVAREITV